MTIARQLYLLQEMDLALDSLMDEKSKAEEELSSTLTVEHLETAFRRKMIGLSRYRVTTSPSSWKPRPCKSALLV